MRMRLQLLGRIARSEKLRSVFGIWLVLTLTVGTPWLDAATYYVDDGSGNDARSSATAQSPATPWKTITHALGAATSGDTIHVAGGTYNTTLGEDFPLSLKSGVQLIGNGAGMVTTVNITNGGSGYTSADVDITGGSG